MGHIEIDVRMPRFFHLRDDGPADHVARGQLAARIVIGHEAMAVAIDQSAPSPRMASVIRLRLLPAMYSTVGWNCMNSMSRSSAPAR